MSDDDNRLPRARARPQSKLFLSISLDNPYARLGISPLASTTEIMDLIDQRRGEANRRLRAKQDRPPDDPDERLVLELDHLAELIGDDRRRAQYDERNPQNILLTMQQSASEQAWRRHSRAGLISDWLNEAVGEDELLPTPNCLRLWTPSGIEPALEAILADAMRQPGLDEARPLDAAMTLSIDHLDSLAGKD